MKIRSGFVSNSSSSSFLIYGAAVSEEDIKEAFTIENEEDEDGYDDFDAYSAIEENIEEDIEVYMPEGGNIYLGRSWSSIEDNQTGKQFKDEISEIIKKYFGKKVKCGTFEECWFN